MSRRIILVRHGAIGARRSGQLIGSSDPPLSRQGREQSVRLAGLLKELAPTSAYCSPLRRARQTAKLALNSERAPLIIDPRLQEINFGGWEGLTVEQARTEDPRAFARWAKGAADFAFPGGERVVDFVKRVATAATAMAADQSETVVAFTHGGVIRHLICHYLGLSVRRHPLLFEVRYASLTTIELFDGKGVLSGLNHSSGKRI